MATQDDFVNAIAANAGDDDLQLVFADWLEERGDTLRAELVRIQVELSKVPKEDGRYPKLLKKERIIWLKWIQCEIRAQGNGSKSPGSARASEESP